LHGQASLVDMQLKRINTICPDVALLLASARQLSPPGAPGQTPGKYRATERGDLL
jgi:hypothetical protein